MFRVEKEIEDLLVPLNEQERSDLEASIKAHGCLEPIVVWNGLLLDGHNRYRICEQLSVPYRTVTIELTDIEQAKRWVIQNQLARRNLSPDAAAMLRGKLRNAVVRPVGRPKSGNECLNITDSELADRFGVSERTLHNDSRFAKAVKILGPEVERAVVQGTAPPRKVIVQAAAAPPEQRAQVAQAIASGAYKTIEPPSGVIRDALGTVVTHPRAKRAFADRPKLKRVVATIASAILQVRRLEGEPVADRLDIKSVLLDLQNAKRTARFALPYRAINDSPDERIRRIGWITELQAKQCKK